MGVTLTGEGINLFRVLTLRSAVILEAKELRFRRSMTARARRELGLPRGASRDDVILALDQAVAAQEQVTRPGVDVRGWGAD